MKYKLTKCQNGSCNTHDIFIMKRKLMRYQSGSCNTRMIFIYIFISKCIYLNARRTREEFLMYKRLNIFVNNCTVGLGEEIIAGKRIRSEKIVPFVSIPALCRSLFRPFFRRPTWSSIEFRPPLCSPRFFSSRPLKPLLKR